MHTKVDNESRFIDKYFTTSANVHDSQVLKKLLDEKDAGQELYADSAYVGEAQEKIIESFEMVNKIHEKAYKNRPLTSEQYKKNKAKSKVRARVEHVYGFMSQTMKAMYIRCVGILRAKAILGLASLVYNMCRLEQIIRLEILKPKTQLADVQ